MLSYSSRTEIEATPEAIFEQVSDILRHRDWAGNDVRLELIEGSSSNERGATFQSAGRELGHLVHNLVTITESSPPSRFVYEARGHEGSFRHTFELHAVAGRTGVTKRMEVLQVNFPYKLLRPFFALSVPRALAGDLRRLKAVVEGNNRS